MAIKEPWRGNPAEKQYQFLTDFSGGINSKIEDSLLKDNVARNITNFDIIAGGLLSKRKGFAPVMASQIREYLKHYFGVVSNNEQEINNLIEKKITNSWTFYTNNNSVICLKVNDGIINIIMSKDEFGKDVISFTNRKFDSKNTIIENYGNRQVLVYFDSSNNASKPFLLSWREDNWVDFNSSLENAFDVTPTVKNYDKEWNGQSQIGRIVDDISETINYGIVKFDFLYRKRDKQYRFESQNLKLPSGYDKDDTVDIQNEFEYVEQFAKEICSFAKINFSIVEQVSRIGDKFSITTSSSSTATEIKVEDVFAGGVFENKYSMFGGKLVFGREYKTRYGRFDSNTFALNESYFMKYLLTNQLAGTSKSYSESTAADSGKVVSLISWTNIDLDLKAKFGNDYYSNNQLSGFPKAFTYNINLTMPMPSTYARYSTRTSPHPYISGATIEEKSFSDYRRTFTSLDTAIFNIGKSLNRQYEVVANKNKYEINNDSFKISIKLKNGKNGSDYKTIDVTKDDFSSALNTIALKDAIEKITFEGCKVIIGNLQTGVDSATGYNNNKIWFTASVGYDRDAEKSDVNSPSVSITGKKVFQPLFIKYFGIDTLELLDNGLACNPSLLQNSDENKKRDTVVNCYRPMGFSNNPSRYNSQQTGWDQWLEYNTGASIEGLDNIANNDFNGGKKGSLVSNISDVELSFEYTDNVLHNAHSSLSGEAISKFVPDAYTFKQLSYNMLSLDENVDISSFETPDFNDPAKIAEFKKNMGQYVQVDGQAPIPTLSSIIQVNGYYPEVNKPAVFKASLELTAKTADERKTEYEDYKFGWLFMPVEKWATLQAQVTSTQQYISDIVAPAFSNTMAGVGYEHSFATIMPQTSNPSIILCFVIKKDKDPKTITNLDDVMQTQLNINPVKAYGEVFTPAEAMRDFSAVDKSIVWKNQMFLYGGSNSFFVSDVNNFGYFPMIYNTQIPSDSQIVSMTIYYDSLIVATDRQQFVITGNSPDDKTNPFTISELNDDIGVAAPKTVKNNANYIFQLTADGVYLVKSLFNFRDRYNTEKVDDAIAGDIISDPNACAVVWNNKYYLCIPSKKQIWIYYNDFKAWIKYESEIFDLNNMFVINDELVLVSNKVGQLYKFSKEDENVHGEGPYQDINFFDKTNTEVVTGADGKQSISPVEVKYPIVSTYKSKEIDFGLPNHDKKLKKLQVRFAETPGSNQLFVNVWIDGTLKVSPDKDVITTNADGTVTKTTTTTPEITTTANSNWVGTAAGEFKSGDVTYTGNRNNVGNKHDQDTDQLHEVIVAGRGRNMQFEIVHRQNKRLNVKNFATLLKVKKPKALRTYSQKG